MKGTNFVKNKSVSPSFYLSMGVRATAAVLMNTSVVRISRRDRRAALGGRAGGGGGDGLSRLSPAMSGVGG